MRTRSEMYPVRALGKGGVIADIGVFDVATNQITEGVNIRVESDNIRSANGWRTLVNTNNTTRYLAPWWNRASNGFAEVLSDRILWYRSLADIVDVTPDAGISDTDSWTSSQHGEWLILNDNNQGVPLVMSPTDLKFDQMENFPTNERVAGMVSYQGHLMAWGVQIGAEDNPYLLHWSDTLAPNSMNPSWDFADPVTLSGTNELAGGLGEILVCEPLADRLYIYQKFGVTLAQWVGGTYIFSFRSLFTDDGLMNYRSVCNFGGQHFCVGQHSIYIHDGANKTPIAEKRVEREFFRNLRDPDSVQCIHVPENDEVWVTYTDTYGATANRVMVWNYTYDSYTFRELPGTTDAVIRSPRPVNDILTWAESKETTWGNTTDDWQSTDPEANDAILLYHDKQNGLIIQGDYTTQAEGRDLVSYVQQSKIDMEELVGNSVDIKMLTSIYPQITGLGTVQISVGGTDRPNQPVQFETVQDFEINRDLKIDCKISNRYLAIKYELSGLGLYRLSGHDLEIKVRNKK